MTEIDMCLKLRALMTVMMHGDATDITQLPIILLILSKMKEEQISNILSQNLTPAEDVEEILPFQCIRLPRRLQVNGYCEPVWCSTGRAGRSYQICL